MSKDTSIAGELSAAPLETGFALDLRTAAELGAKAQGIEDVSAKSLLRNEKVIAKVREEIEAKSQGFKSYEKIKQFTLIEEDFTTENGMLTPSMKVKRRVVLEKYGNLVEDMYR